MVPQSGRRPLAGSWRSIPDASNHAPHRLGRCHRRTRREPDRGQRRRGWFPICRPRLRQQQHDRPEHDRRFRPPRRRLPDSDRRFAVRRRRSRDGRSVRVSRRPPANTRRPLPAGDRSGVERDLRPADQATRRPPARRRPELERDRAGQHRRSRKPGLRREWRGRRQQLHRLPAECGRPPALNSRVDLRPAR